MNEQWLCGKWLKVKLQFSYLQAGRRVARIWKGGKGGFFERVRQLQATLTRIFIVLESDSNGLSKIETDFSAEIGNSNGNFGTKSLRGGGLFSFLEQKSASKALKTCDFPYFSGQWGGGSSPASRPSYATASWYR